MKPESVPQKKILSLLSPEDFIGRDLESNKILQYAKSESSERCLLVPAEPGAGLTEFLRQSYDALFAERGETIPVFFAFSKNDKTAEDCARRFLREFLVQIIAFRFNAESLLKIAPDICEISEFAVQADLKWTQNLINACESESYLNDKISFVRQAFSAPLRANENNVRTAVFFDDLQYAGDIKNGINLLEEIKQIFLRSSAPVVFGGRRRFVLNAVQSGNIKFRDFEVLNLKGLSETDAAFLVGHLAEKTGVKVNEQTRDLLIRKFDGKPLFIEETFSEATRTGDNLDDFYSVEKVYVNALFSGGIGKYFDTIFNETASSGEVQKKIAGLASCDEDTTAVELWRKRLGLEEPEFNRVISHLHINEIVNATFGTIRVPSANDVLCDYLKARHSLAVVGEQRALVVANTLSSALKRAPQLMMRHYRRLSAIGLRDLMAVFRCREIPEILFDYEEYKRKYKGEAADDVWSFLQGETEKVALPQMVYTANCAAVYPPISRVSDDERAAVALGFERGNYTKDNEIVWIAAEIDSKLEASPELAEFWCDRLEVIALICNFAKYQLWLITPEGFSPEACEVLRQRKVFGSSLPQVELLIKFLNAENLIKEKNLSNEYEMVVPMGGNTELIAAHAVEEIARRHSFEPKAVNQIKTALVEACINAAEHSHSPDRKIYQKITVEGDKIVITVSNRGIKIPDGIVLEAVTKIEPDEGRRGWGLKLMRTLMDEVKFEQVDDGTRILMTKYLKKNG